MVTGKLPNDLLEKVVLKYVTHTREDVITGSAVGLDNALVDFGEEVAILSTDPITGAVSGIGKLAVNIACNDVAASGGKPIGILLTILVPPEVTHADIETIMKDAGETAAELDVEIIGGHTEVTDAVNKVVISATAIGKIAKSNLQDMDEIAVGDKILMTKSAGLEGTAILLSDYSDYFADKMDAEYLSEGQTYGQYLSVVEDGRIGGAVGINYMHDITEGGVLGAVWEAQNALDKGVRIHLDQIPLTAATQQLCNIIDINPYRLISSGSMLMIANEEQIEELMLEFEAHEIPLTIIGEVIEEGLELIIDQEVDEIAPPHADELYIALDKLSNS